MDVAYLEITHFTLMKTSENLCSSDVLRRYGIEMEHWLEMGYYVIFGVVSIFPLFHIR